MKNSLHSGIMDRTLIKNKRQQQMDQETNRMTVKDMEVQERTTENVMQCWHHLINGYNNMGKKRQSQQTGEECWRRALHSSGSYSLQGQGQGHNAMY